ncbi:MAG: low molecular weight phosphotyrosine protein phosphatase [Mongoliibacter sp.]|uniref:low molecular weight protein-tyrosine-phosphatase n=1 Tax=Mongoliibacter sp. TaxID=2022438 RepID=UPI0012EF3261|nr:low molecular weight protein-tyrosine-phosphatase [Mongoliibacter sp.]TVP49011.1 MAG: low molecular weight phosphotyrosine protein phosphatase [Mongoliibacter sp.]
MIKVLFVCLGNICRSPLAEAIFNHKVKNLGLQQKLICDSCGTSDYHIGELPDERTLACLENHKIAINHRARKLNRVDIREFDYLIAMDQSNKENIEQLIFKNSLKHNNVYLIREFQPDTDNLDVPDPYYGGQDGFENVYQILDDSIDRFLEHIKVEHQEYV